MVRVSIPASHEHARIEGSFGSDFSSIRYGFGSFQTHTVGKFIRSNPYLKSPRYTLGEVGMELGMRNQILFYFIYNYIKCLTQN